MTTVKFYDAVSGALPTEDRLKFAVILAKAGENWVFCKHRARDTWEIPGGHREPEETIEETARRELFEETGALSYELAPICAYSVAVTADSDTEETFGMLYCASIHAFDGELHSEIERILFTREPEKLVWTYPEIQPALMAEGLRRGCFSAFDVDAENLVVYRGLLAEESTVELFRAFHRRQVVTKCWRREGEAWVIRDAPFIDDWSREEYEALAARMKNVILSGGLAKGAFIGGELKGFVTVEASPIGSAGQYLDLTELNVSEEVRRRGIGRVLFGYAAEFARRRGKKLYLSAHSAVESQAFYRAMGCVEAEEYDSGHVAKEPFDCQLEY